MVGERRDPGFAKPVLQLRHEEPPHQPRNRGRLNRVSELAAHETPEAAQQPHLLEVADHLGLVGEVERPTQPVPMAQRAQHVERCRQLAAHEHGHHLQVDGMRLVGRIDQSLELGAAALARQEHAPRLQMFP